MLVFGSKTSIYLKVTSKQIIFLKEQFLSIIDTIN